MFHRKSFSKITGTRPCSSHSLPIIYVPTDSASLTVMETLIVKTTIQEAADKPSVVVHADDVDIFCMLLHHYDESMGDVCFQTVKKKNEDPQI